MVSGFIGAGIGGMAFITSHQVLTQYLYSGRKAPSWLNELDFRLKNLLIFCTSEIVGSVVKLPFETRKQLVQMSNYNISLQLIARNSMYGLCPLLLRDSSFRFLMLGSVYLTTDIEHRPVLKYSIQ